MQPKIFLERFTEYLNHIQPNQEFGGWHYIDKFENRGFCFRFKKNNYYFFIRSVLTKNYISILYNDNSQLHEMDLNKDNVYETIENNIYLYESYSMTVGDKEQGVNPGKVDERTVVEYFRKIGQSDNRISIINVNNPKYDKLIEDLLNWAIIRSEVKKMILTNKRDSHHNKISNNENLKDNDLNQIFYGPPGTGKTYMSIREAIKIIKPDFKVDESKELEQKEKEEKAEFERLKNEGKIEFITFHQSMTYEDFIEGIKPLLKNEEDNIVNKRDDQLKYQIEDGIFKTMSHYAAYDFYVSIFRTLLDKKNDIELETKKQNKKFKVSFNKNDNISLKTGTNFKQVDTITKDNFIKYLKGNKIIFGKTIIYYFESFLEYLIGIYKNDEKVKQDVNNRINKYVLIVDEINRGNISQIFGELITLIEEDKRIGNDESLEVTLPYSKEKFGVPPNLYIIGTMNTADRSIEALDTALRRRFSFREYKPESKPIENKIINDISLKDLLKKINERLELLLDKDHLIGHSYFMEVTNIDDLKDVFQDKIIPLLQEYFYGDFGKIGLVLGKYFFENEGKQDKTKTDFAHFPSYEDTDDLKERKVYRLNNVKEMNDEEFGKAIEELLGNNGKQNEQE